MNHVVILGMEPGQPLVLHRQAVLVDNQAEPGNLSFIRIISHILTADPCRNGRRSFILQEASRKHDDSLEIAGIIKYC